MPAISGAAIAGIVIVSALGIALLVWGIYYIIQKRKRDAAYLDRCGRLWNKYGNRDRPEMMPKYPYAGATFVRTPVPGQQFTSRELKSSMGTSQEFVLPQRKTAEGADDADNKNLSMYAPIDPDLINPRLYSNDFTAQQDSHSSKRPPQVFFSIEFDKNFNILKIFVNQARYLKPRTYTSMCDPYCTVNLLPGHTEKQSQVMRRTMDPLFQEHFSFGVPIQELPKKKLQIKFFNYDQFSRDEFTGIVEQKLDEINLDAKVDLWRKIQNVDETENKSTKNGDILLRLGYLPSAEKLTVVLLKARNLLESRPEKEARLPDPYIRVTVWHDGNILKKKKTSTKRRTCNPTYNQAINFAVPLDVLPQVEIQFHVVNEIGVKLNRAERKEAIGYLEIGPHSNGDEFEHWRDLMSNKPQARWHHLVDITDVDIKPTGSSISHLDLDSGISQDKL
uniref:Synaptotagmin-5-like n=1 Tax=Ciona intestinalis TaxID=7719 RepID=F6T780_CIOIN|nr:synaptotagmin-5-like isoform X1 [Ciona intestinalis]XP_026694322.1 synaptotagmin-5-like isoform X1 [Ciona intestinalis]|eukprot:XP_002128383.1 synaptotagmin-5-like isoform X1 [Ciona intestinalis]